jgi:hypothetical protein
LFTNSRTFKTLNFCFQIQGHSRTFKFCTNPGLYKTATWERRLNKPFDINDCIEILSCIYFRMNLTEFGKVKGELYPSEQFWSPKARLLHKTWKYLFLCYMINAIVLIAVVLIAIVFALSTSLSNSYSCNLYRPYLYRLSMFSEDVNTNNSFVELRICRLYQFIVQVFLKVTFIYWDLKHTGIII